MRTRAIPVLIVGSPPNRDADAGLAQGQGNCAADATAGVGDERNCPSK